MSPRTNAAKNQKPSKARAPRLDWSDVLEQAAEIVRSYDTGVTLRQLFYRLVAAQKLENTQGRYKSLSERTAKARRDGRFPDLVDFTRTIERHPSWSSPRHALDALAQSYRVDRTGNQDVSLYIGVEKKGLVAQLSSWFGDLGIPILALGGYSSQSYVKQVAEDATRQDRKAVLLYAGDHDPSGEDIDRDFVDRTGCFDDVVRVALSWEQVREFDLPPAMGKADDSRAAAFSAKYGRLVQVELDALPPDVLRSLYTEAIGRFWATSAFEDSLEQERRGRDLLDRLAEKSLAELEGWLNTDAA